MLDFPFESLVCLKVKKNPCARCSVTNKKPPLGQIDHSLYFLHLCYGFGSFTELHLLLGLILPK